LGQPTGPDRLVVPKTSLSNYHYKLRNFLSVRVVLRSTATGDALLGEGRSGLAFLAIWDNDGVCSPSGKYVYIQLMISDIRQVFPKPTAQVCCQLKQQPHNQLAPKTNSSNPARRHCWLRKGCACGLGSARCITKNVRSVREGGARVHAVSKAASIHEDTNSVGHSCLYMYRVGGVGGGGG